MTLQAGKTVDAQSLRRACGAFATGVTVVTVGGGVPHGMTANSFASVSLEPPLLLVCIDRKAIMHGCLDGTRSFGVSVLAADQEAVARYFADRRRPLGAAQFDSVDWRPGPVTGAPLISGALAHFECDVWRSYDGGDHTIYLGSVLSVGQPEGADALVFLRGRFDRTGPAARSTEVSEVSTPCP
ncbi:flavin reductase family protein [Plantactinospora sp. WMMC1484]|uniref:flavin reductase family protein n=1 Tax=Plantactinospora sp. WMMC1484 TaxID=3404122 RepID=UPI003BF5BC30